MQLRGLRVESLKQLGPGPFISGKVFLRVVGSPALLFFKARWPLAWVAEESVGDGLRHEHSRLSIYHSML